MHIIRSKKKVKISKLHYSHKNYFLILRFFKSVLSYFTSPEFLTNVLNRFNLV